ncbi:MAG: hypothetical protein IPP38_09975 [Bacteroidetes bacterium]|nr:hypothetical protein [Bacteroidota bacterium]
MMVDMGILKEERSLILQQGFKLRVKLNLIHIFPYLLLRGYSSFKKMYQENNIFPFGQPLRQVKQKSRTNKDVFVLGVYASAVHARWVDARGKQIVAALAVASEPEIFWRGDGAEKIISEIHVPAEVGRLEPAAAHLNGPSGNVLDQKYLEPLGFKREQSWLCDLLPESRVNEKQRAAIDKYYKPIVKKYDLPESTVPDFDISELDSLKGRKKYYVSWKNQKRTR